MRVFAEGKLGIYLVRDNHYIGILKHSGDCLKILFFHYSAGRIARIRKNKRLCFRGYLFDKLLRRNLEIVLRLCLYYNRNASRKSSKRLIANIARLRDYNLVSLLDDSSYTSVDRFASAYRNEYLLVRIVSDLLLSVNIIRKLGSEHFESPV